MRSIFKGSASHSEYVALVDSSTGLPKTGIASTDVTGSYTRTRSTRTAITVSALGSAGAAYSSGGWFEVDSTNQPGLYRFDVPDAAFASGVDQVYVTVKATGCKTEHKEFRLIDWNDQVAAIPNAAAGANGGLPTGNASGQVAVASLANNAITAAAIAADAITAAKIADGAIDAATFAAGAIDAAAIATDAIGSAELAASAVSEIQSGLMLAASYAAPPSAATIAAAVWDYLTSAATTVGSLGKRIADNLDAAVNSRLASASYTAPDNSTISAIAAKTTNLPSDPADASDIAAAFGTVATTLGTISGYIDTEVAAIKARTDLIPDAPAAVGDVPTAAANAAALLDSANGVETGLTPRGALRLISAALAGVLSGAGTSTVVVKNAVANTKTRITATTDESGNRSVVNTDVS